VCPAGGAAAPAAAAAACPGGPTITIVLPAIAPVPPLVVPGGQAVPP
jgi:hypothetical protein